MSEATGYLEFSYNEAKVNDIVADLASAKNRLSPYNVENLIQQLKNCRGWSRVSNYSLYESQLGQYKTCGKDYAGIIDNEKNKISETLAILKSFDGEVVTTETNWWASAGMAFFNFTEGFLTGFEQVLDGLMTGAAILTGWLGMEGVSKWLSDAVEFEIFGEMFDYLFENVEFFKNIEAHAAWAHDDAKADIFKGVGTIASYVVMAAIGGGAIGGKTVSLLGHAVKIGGGAWTGAASIIADMAVTAVGTLGAETQKGLQSGQNINEAAWNAMDDVLLNTAIAGGVGSLIEFGPGWAKQGLKKLKGLGGEAAEETTSLVLKNATQGPSNGIVKRILDGAESLDVVVFKNGAGETVATATKEEFEMWTKQFGTNSAQEIAEKLGMVGITDVAPDVFVKDAAKGWVPKAMSNAAGDVAQKTTTTVFTEGASQAAETTALTVFQGGAKEAAGTTALTVLKGGAKDATGTTAVAVLKRGASEGGQQLITSTLKGITKEGAGEALEGMVKGGFRETVEGFVKGGARETVENATKTWGKKVAIHAADDILRDDKPVTPKVTETTQTPTPPPKDPPKSTETPPVPKPDYPTQSTPSTPTPTPTPTPTTPGPKPINPEEEWPTGPVINDINKGEDSDFSSLTDKFGSAADLGEIIDLAGGVNIPTSPDPIRTKVNTKDNKMIPLMAGLGAAALAGLGTKAYLERKENRNEEEELDVEEWDENAEELALNSLETEDYNNELEESDYLLPTDEYAFQPEAAIASDDEEDDDDRYQAVNSSDLPSMN